MKILVDNNISPRVISLLDKFLSDSRHIAQLGLDINTEDGQIWDYAKKKAFQF